MLPKRDIQFTTTLSKTRLSQEGKVRYQGQLKHNQVLSRQETRQGFADYLHIKAPLVNSWFEALSGYIAEEIAMGNRMDFGPFAVGLKMRGGFPAANASFDPKTNAVAVEIMPSKYLKQATSTLRPINTTMDDRCYISWNRQTLPYEMTDAMTMDGTRSLITTGNQILVHAGGEGEGVWVENDQGEKLLEGTVTAADCWQLCSTFTGHIDAGLYWFVVMSRHTESAELLTSRRRIRAE